MIYHGTPQIWYSQKEICHAITYPSKLNCTLSYKNPSGSDSVRHFGLHYSTALAFLGVHADFEIVHGHFIDMGCGVCDCIGGIADLNRRRRAP